MNSRIEEQIWKEIPKTNGNYLISNTGVVKNAKTNHISKTVKLTGGYVYVYLNRSGEKRGYKRLHRIVAETFVPNPQKKPCVNHIDGNKENNSSDNLEWCTHKENTRHLINSLGFKIAESSKKKVLCVETGKIYNSVVEAAKDVGVSRPAISHILIGKYETSAGFHWRYA